MSLFLRERKNKKRESLSLRERVSVSKREGVSVPETERVFVLRRERVSVSKMKVSVSKRENLCPRRAATSFTTECSLKEEVFLYKGEPLLLLENSLSKRRKKPSFIKGGHFFYY